MTRLSINGARLMPFRHSKIVKSERQDPEAVVSDKWAAVVKTLGVVAAASGCTLSRDGSIRIGKKRFLKVVSADAREAVVKWRTFVKGSKWQSQRFHRENAEAVLTRIAKAMFGK